MASSQEHQSSREKYERALMVLNSMKCDLSHESAIYGSLHEKKTRRIDVMLSCFERLHMKKSEIETIPIIHVTGTKGKGSTCAYVDNILRQYGFKTGLLQSPHVKCARERICLNGKLVDEGTFISAFWCVYDQLLITKASDDFIMPIHFSMTLLMALKIFVEKKVDVMILEVGIGGEYDATNFIQKPVACGVTSLHVEHAEMLGNTVREIAWHKSGIAKTGVPLVTVEQDTSAMEVILSRAKEKKCPLYVAPKLETESSVFPCLAIAGDKQPINAALAVQLCRAFLHHKGQDPPIASEKWDDSVEAISDVTYIPKKFTYSSQLTDQERRGLEEAPQCLVGRGNVIKRKGVTYYLDGAHTMNSIEGCLEWFRKSTVAEVETELQGKTVQKALVFRMKDLKKAKDIIRILKEDITFVRTAFTSIVVCNNRMKYPDLLDPTEAPKTSREHADSLLGLWESIEDVPLQRQSESLSFDTILQALWWAGGRKDQTLTTKLEDEAASLLGEDDQADDGTHVQVLVTGSFVVVGGALCLLEP